MIVAVTGADDFIGRRVCRALLKSEYEVRPLVRNAAGAVRARTTVEGMLPPVIVGDIGSGTDWSQALAGVGVVVHLAGSGLSSQGKGIVTRSTHHEVNVRGTVRLAREAAVRGVRRVLFTSTAMVLGANTNGRQPFTDRDLPAPAGYYAKTKWKAEQELLEIAKTADLETVILRTPLVHGAGVGGNLLRLLRKVDKGLPLPFAGVNNRRSMMGAENLADLIAICIEHPAAAGRVFLACDGRDISTPDLIRELAAGMNRSARLIAAPKGLLRLFAGMTGRRGEINQLLGSLRIDPQTTCDTLGWQPNRTLSEGVREMARWYRESGGGLRG